MEHIYSVEIEVHYEGISHYHLFSSPKKALDFAVGYMSQRTGNRGDHFQNLEADSVADPEGVFRVWAGTIEDVIIRKKSLMG